MKFVTPEGATPLDPDEADGLLLSHITTRAELSIDISGKAVSHRVKLA